MKSVATFNTAACALGLGLSLVGCDLDRANSTAIESGQAVRRTSVQVETGRRACATYCVGCHGAKGDGNGNAARFLRPRPHDLTIGRFKFSSTRAGLLPTDADLRRTIVLGLKGSAMPGWKMLSAPTVNALIAYVKTFSPRWDQPPPASPLSGVVNPSA